MNDTPKQMHVIRPDGKIIITDLTKHPETHIIHDAIDGYLEAVPHFTKYHGRSCVVFCDEDGKRKNKPYNAHATALWDQCVGGVVADHLVGNIVIITGPQDWLKRM